jgi:plastocyanin domain-containing protein
MGSGAKESRTLRCGVTVVLIAALVALALGVGACGTAVAAQTCSECGKKGMAPMVMGKASTADGVQVLKVSVVGGYYSPNRFTVAAGTPVKVVFSGSAKGCIAMPKFAALGKQADFAKSGSATVDLGTLEPGTYTWTCAMGMNAGKITVR